MQDARVRAALLVICLVCLLGSAVVLFAGHRTQPPPVVITPAPADAVSPSETAPAATVHPMTAIYVDVSGAVRRPSLYVLPPGSRVMQAIRAAGGPNAEADLDAVNLAQKVTDGEKVYVPKRGVSPPPVGPTDNNGAAPMIGPTPSGTRLAGKGAKGGSKGGHSNKLTADSGEQIGLNTATAEQLERLPGVGPSMAARILAYRAQAGGFNKVEDLMQVTGIGPKKFAKIAPFVKLD